MLLLAQYVDFNPYDNYFFIQFLSGDGWSLIQNIFMYICQSEYLSGLAPVKFQLQFLQKTNLAGGH